MLNSKSIPNFICRMLHQVAQHQLEATEVLKWGFLRWFGKIPLTLFYELTTFIHSFVIEIFSGESF